MGFFHFGNMLYFVATVMFVLVEQIMNFLAGRGGSFNFIYLFNLFFLGEWSDGNKADQQK